MVEDLHVVSLTELTHFIQYLKQGNDICISKGWKAALKCCLGAEQTTQIAANGELVTPEVSSYMWTHTCILAKVSLNELIPTVANELATTTLCKFVNILESACQHNFASALLLLGGDMYMMSYHDTKITTQFGGFPVVLMSTTPTAPTEGVNTPMEAVNTTPMTTRSSSEGKPLHFPKDCAKAAHCTEPHAPYML